MKINWFSPLPPAKTGIAEYATYVVPALSEYADVVVWTDQLTWSSQLEQYASVRSYEPTNLSWSDINQADLNIYHIGNNPVFHSGIWEVSRKCPGLVILHDFRLQHFFIAIFREQWRDWDAYLSQMIRYYGPAARQVAEKVWNSRLTIESIAEQYPFTPLALENAVGVITHTKEAFDSLQQEKHWPVVYAPLPYFSKRQLNRNTMTKSLPYRLIMFGHIGGNRRLDILLEALSSFSDKSYFHLDIYGEILNLDYIRSKVQRLNISELVTLYGFVEEAVLDLALANADLAINLRYPTMGEASISQLRIWSHALPSLVTQVGWYANLPKDTVAFVRPEHEIDDIQQQLRKFLAYPKDFLAMGRNGQHTLEQQHTPTVYAQSIINCANNIRDYKHQLVADELVQRVGKQISTWSDRNILDGEIKRVAEAIHFIST